MPFVAGQRGLASDMLVEHNADGTHDLPDRTEALWVRAHPDESSTHGRHGAWLETILDLATESALFIMRVPDNFVSLGTVRVVLIPTGTGAFDWTCNTSSGACGEDEAANTDSATADAQAVVDDQILCLDVTAAFNGLGLAAGDFIGIQFVLDALDTTTQLLVLGLEFGYTGSR